LTTLNNLRKIKVKSLAGYFFLAERASTGDFFPLDERSLSLLGLSAKSDHFGGGENRLTGPEGGGALLLEKLSVPAALLTKVSLAFCALNGARWGASILASVSATDTGVPAFLAAARLSVGAAVPPASERGWTGGGMLGRMVANFHEGKFAMEY
jgi:hypothetical protein